MALTKNYRKNIACLESFWNKDIENRLSVAPILEILSKRNGIKFTHLTCNTKEELEYNLNLLKRKKGYEILYLAFHGKPGRICLDGTSVDVETLSEFMGKGFNNWVIYFGSCATLDVKKERIIEFMRNTGGSIVIGYDQYIDWLISTALDLILLDSLQSYKNMRSFWSFLERTFQGIPEITGLKVFHK